MRPTHRPLTPLIKVAAGNNMLKVGPRPDRWVQEAIQRLQEEHPYLSEYSLRGNLKNSDAEKQYGMGYIDVRHHSDSPMRTAGIKIPFVIEKGLLHPLKVFMNDKGRADLLDKEIVGQALFSPHVSHSLTEQEAPTSLMGALYPPDRTRFGMGGMVGGAMKTGSAVDTSAPTTTPIGAPWLGDEAEAYLKQSGVVLTAQERQQIHKTAQARLAERNKPISILNKIAHTLSRSQLRDFKNTVTVEVADHFRDHRKHGMVEALFALKPVEERIKTAGMLEQKPTDYTVCQVERVGAGRYLIKRAGNEVFEPSRDLVSVTDVASVVGEDLVADIRENGRTTVSTEAAIQQNLDDVVVETIHDYGIFKVQSLETGDHLVGWVITNVLDFYGGAMPLNLFTNGTHYALQENIAGVRVSQGTALPRRVPKGGDFGAFYYVSPSGRATALLPVTIAHEEEIHGTKYWQCVDIWGKPLRVTMAPDLRRVAETGDREFVLPDTMLFMPLKREMRLVPEPLLFSKTASPNNARLFYNGAFGFDGPAVEKVSKAYRYGLSEADAELLGVALGLDVQDCRVKLAMAMKYGETEILARPLVSQAYRNEKIAQTLKSYYSSPAAQAAIKEAAALRKDTVKIAASLPSMAKPESVDAVLSLNFINHENLQLFIESLPHLETARRDLAEMYISTSVGLPDVSATAIIRAMENLAEVIKGLQKVKMRAKVV